MKYRAAGALLALALAAVAPAAQAQQLAWTAKQVNLRAGPDRSYPVVAILPAVVEVVVQGCIPDYRWCDVSFGGERGWVYAGNLRYGSVQGPVPLIGAAPQVGITIVPFVLYDYWGLHYRDRPWYPERDRWLRPRPRALPPPPQPHLHPPPRVHPPPPPPPRVHAPSPGHVRPPGQVRPPDGRDHPRPPPPGDRRHDGGRPHPPPRPEFPPPRP